MAKVTKVKVTFSESGDMEGREFNSVIDFDIACIRACRDMSVEDMWYYKTDFEIVWDDGEFYAGQVDVNRGMNLSRHIQNQIRYHNGPRPKFFTPKQWNMRQELWSNFWKNRTF